jgi:hypothetical protein
MKMENLKLFLEVNTLVIDSEDIEIDYEEIEKRKKLRKFFKTEEIEDGIVAPV